MSGLSMHMRTADICKNGRCPLCDQTVNLISETDTHYTWECTSCSDKDGNNKIWRRRVEENPT